jgi:hypothetical protein
MTTNNSAKNNGNFVVLVQCACKLLSSRCALSKLIPSPCEPTPEWLHGMVSDLGMSACQHVASAIVDSTLLPVCDCNTSRHSILSTPTSHLL